MIKSAVFVAVLALALAAPASAAGDAYPLGLNNMVRWLGLRLGRLRPAII